MKCGGITYQKNLVGGVGFGVDGTTGEWTNGFDSAMEWAARNSPTESPHSRGVVTIGSTNVLEDVMAAYNESLPRSARSTASNMSTDNFTRSG